jgi:hypothetical protein
MPTASPTETDKQARLHELLTRPRDQRLREYKYRFGQSIVFGLPVIALHFWGANLGPVDSQRWSSLLQSLLCGWVVYVNLGMLFEGFVDRRLTSTSTVESRLRGDFIVATIALSLYLYSVISAIKGIITSHLWYPTLFQFCIILLSTWSAWRWWRLGFHNRD